MTPEISAAKKTELYKDVQKGILPSLEILVTVFISQFPQL